MASGPPASTMPHIETRVITMNAITPCWKSAMITPQ